MVAIISTALLAGCGQKIQEGEVVNKWHEPEHRWLQQVPMKVGSVTIYNQIWHVDDEDWCISIEGTNWSKSEPTVERRTLYVSESQYNAFKLGDWVRVSDDVDTEDKVSTDS